MCGIAGIFSPAGRINQGDVAAVGRMTAAQLHRGPDDGGAFDDEYIALGHRRLSIIDLSAAGRQPLSNEDSTVWVVANGEIYNYRELTRELAGEGHAFRSACDSEILVHGYEQWGLEGMLRRLRGMFAFILYDARRKVCFAARDRLGIKPLYYAVAPDGRYAFASEVKTLAFSGFTGGAIDPDAMAGFLLFGSVPHPLTWRREVRCPEPGSFMEVAAAGMRTVRYWSAETAGVQGKNGDGAKILATAIGQHLISDAPLGVFLSSGVDSIGLVALAKRAGVSVRTLTVTFDEADYNEDTSGTARLFGAEHSEIRVTAKDFMDEIPHVLAAMDQPAADGLNTFFVARAAHRAGLKTVLSGLGGDEVFQGYRHYHWLARFERELNAFGHLPESARRFLCQVAATAGVGMGNEQMARVRGLGEATNESLYLAIRGFFAPEVVSRLTGRSEREILGARQDGRPDRFGDIAAFQIEELKRYLHDQLLRDADVFGMAWSLEIRVPYLDHEVVEQALAPPGNRHMRPGVNKPMLVDAIGDDAVTAAAGRRKTGFTFPLDKWMRRHSAELRERALGADLDRTEIKRLWAAFEGGRMNAVRAWALVVMGSLREGSV